MNAEIYYETKTEDAGKTIETILRKKFGVSSGLMTFLKAFL